MPTTTSTPAKYRRTKGATYLQGSHPNPPQSQARRESSPVKRTSVSLRNQQPSGPINIPASRAVRAPAVCHGQEPGPNRSLSPLAAGRLFTWGSSSFADAGCDNAAPAPRSLPASRAGCPAPGVAIRGCPDDRDGAGGERSDIDGIGRGLVVGRAGVATLTRFGVPVAWFRVCPPGLRLGLTLVPTVS